jgi:hypothetical protein
MSLMYKIQLPIKQEPNPNHWSRDKFLTVYPEHKYVEALKVWCKECIGSNGWNYYGMYRKVPCEFRFKKPEDLLAFKLAHGL